MKIYNYNLNEYNFVGLFQELFNIKDLQSLHETQSNKYDLFVAPGTDSDTVYHKAFYDRMRSGWPEFLNTYHRLIKEVVAPSFTEDSELIFQKWPSFRVHLPKNVAVGGWHSDSEYNHPRGEMNFITPITPMYESNTIIVESAPGKRDFTQIELQPGQLFQFDGNRCTHGNLPNRTGVTRISFDFRIMATCDYDANHELTSLSHGNKFVIGSYYEKMKL